MDRYCERTGLEFWSEPLNALTNASFLLAALFAFRTAKRREALSPPIQILIGLAFTVGVGSFLFHTFATLWAKYLDVIPIFSLMLYFVWVYSREHVGLGRTAAGVLDAALLLASVAGLQLEDVLNGSLMYVPAWSLLVAFGAWHIHRSKVEPWTLVTASAVLLIALTFRTIDLAVCGTIPFGTHFLWHLFNGLVVYLVIHSLIVNPPRADEIPA